MDKPQISKFEMIAPIIIQKYERYLPTAFDESMTLLEKLNKVIEYMNQVGLIVGEVVEQWNEVMEWTMNDGLNQAVIDKMDLMIEQGVFNDLIINGIFPVFQSRLSELEKGFAPYATNISEFNGNGDGVENNASAFNSIVVGENVWLPNGNYKLSSNATINGNLVVSPNAKIVVGSGVTLTIRGKIHAYGVEMFVDNGGVVDLQNSENEYNLAWFDSGNGYINERWDFVRRGMKSFVKKKVRIPQPFYGQKGVRNDNGRLYWLFNDSFLIDDKQNTCSFYVDGEFMANNNMNNFILISDVAKPESVFFYGDIQVIANSNLFLGCGINIQSAARVTFFGNVVINGARTSVKIGGESQVAPVTDVRFFMLQCSFFSEKALSIYGKAGLTTQFIQIDRITATASQVTGLNAVEIKGLIRNVKIGDITYTTDVAKDGYLAFDAENVLLVESNAEGSLIKVEIDSIYQANANNCVKISTSTNNPQSNDKLQAISIKHVYGKFNSKSVDISDCNGVYIENVYNQSDVVISSTANYVDIKAKRGLRNITDNGNYTTINNVGKQTRGGNVPPAPAIDWAVGSFIRETSDGKLYLRVAKNGTSEDFILIR